MEKFLKNKYCFSRSMSMTDISEPVVKKREEAITDLANELAKYKILFKDLYTSKPNESESNLILNVAFYIVENSELYEQLLENNKLVVSELIKYTKRNNLFFEKWNDYIITYALILGEERYRILKDYFSISLTDAMLPKNNESKVEQSNILKGLVIAIGNNSIIVMTKHGIFFKSRKDHQDIIGTEVHRQSKKQIKHLGAKILILCVFIATIIYAAYINYTNVVTTVMLQTTSNIRLEVNKYDKVVEATAKDKAGQQLIDETNLIDMNIDEALSESLRYADKNKMIYDNKVLITILGKELNYGSLKQTGTYLKSKKINVLVNNAGQQHKLLESIDDLAE